jgi:hypothetical protein
MENNTEIKKTKIYRFQFSNDFNNKLYQFSKIHKNDNRKEFKEAWNSFVIIEQNIIQQEIKYLEEVGYTGDILNKMFNSARYYFIKKTTIPVNTVKKKRCYQTVTKELLDSIDNHIKINLSQNNYKPSIYFDNYCNDNSELIEREILYLLKNGYTNINDAKYKIKKTYKNRYYLSCKV